MPFLPENRMCAPPFATKQRPPIWKILDPPLRPYGPVQWWIQDFPEGGANPQSGCANLLFRKFFAENCMKMKEFGPRGGAHVPGAPLDPQIQPITLLVFNNHIYIKY